MQNARRAVSKYQYHPVSSWLTYFHRYRDNSCPIADLDMSFNNRVLTIGWYPGTELLLVQRYRDVACLGRELATRDGRLRAATSINAFFVFGRLDSV